MLYEGGSCCVAWAVVNVIKLETIANSKISITCGACKNHAVLEVANLISVLGEDATTHDVRQRHVCPKCNSKGNNTYKVT